MQSKKRLIIISLIVCIILVGVVLVLVLVVNQDTRDKGTSQYGGTRVINPGSDEWQLSKMYTEIYLGTEAAEERFKQSDLEAVAASEDTKYKEAKTGTTLDEYLTENNLTISDVSLYNYNYTNMDITSERPKLLLEYDLSKYDCINYYNVQNEKDNHNLDIFNLTGMTTEEFKEMINYLIEHKRATLITEDIDAIDKTDEPFVVILEMREGELPEDAIAETRPLKYVTFTFYKKTLIRDLINDIVEETSLVSINIDLPLDFIMGE